MDIATIVVAAVTLAALYVVHEALKLLMIEKKAKMQREER